MLGVLGLGELNRMSGLELMLVEASGCECSGSGLRAWYALGNV